MKDLSYDQFLEVIRGAKPKGPGFASELRELMDSESPLPTALFGLLELKAGYTQAAVNEHLTDDASRLRAIGLRGQIMGIEAVLKTFHDLMNDEVPTAEEQIDG